MFFVVVFVIVASSVSKGYCVYVYHTVILVLVSAQYTYSVIGIGNIVKNGYWWNPSQNVPLTLTDLGPCASQDVQSFVSWPITVCVTVCLVCNCVFVLVRMSHFHQQPHFIRWHIVCVTECLVCNRVLVIVIMECRLC